MNEMWRKEEEEEEQENELKYKKSWKIEVGHARHVDDRISS